MAKREGGLSSAPLLIESHDFVEVTQLQAAAEWDGGISSMAVLSQRNLCA